MLPLFYWLTLCRNVSLVVQTENQNSTLFPVFLNRKKWHGLLRNEWHGLLRNHWHGLHRNHWHGLLRNEWHGMVRNSQQEIHLSETSQIKVGPSSFLICRKRALVFPQLPEAVQRNPDLGS